jgi:hypothetical protein
VQVARLRVARVPVLQPCAGSAGATLRWGGGSGAYGGTGVGRWLLGGLGDEQGAASRRSARVDGKIDHALDAALDRLYELVAGKLGADPALAKLQMDAQQGVEEPRTHKRLQLAVEDAVDQDPRFAAELGQLLQQIQAFGPPNVGRSTTVRADRRGIAAGGNVVQSRGNQFGHRFGALGAVMVVLIGAVTFIYYQSTHGGPSAAEVVYQQQVLATCEQAHGVLSADHGEVMRLSPNFGGITDPRQMAIIDKTALLRVLDNNLVQVQAAFAQLDQRDIPPSLRDRKKAVDQALAGWVTSSQEHIRTVQTTVRDGMNLAQLQQTLPQALQGPDVTQTRLVSAMSDLAGKTCSI